MIIIRIVEGPYAGNQREIVRGEYEGHAIDPAILFIQLMRLGSRWEIDYSRVDDLNEAIAWGRADLTARYLRALREKRPVFCLGTEYRAGSLEDAQVVAQMVEDQIVRSGYDVTLGFDNDSGVSIVAVKRSNEVQ